MVYGISSPAEGSAVKILNERLGWCCFAYMSFKEHMGIKEGRRLVSLVCGSPKGWDHGDRPNPGNMAIVAYVCVSTALGYQSIGGWIGERVDKVYRRSLQGQETGIDRPQRAHEWWENCDYHNTGSVNGMAQQWAIEKTA